MHFCFIFREILMLELFAEVMTFVFFLIILFLMLLWLFFVSAKAFFGHRRHEKTMKTKYKQLSLIKENQKNKRHLEQLCTQSRYDFGNAMERVNIEIFDLLKILMKKIKEE